MVYCENCKYWGSTDYQGMKYCDFFHLYTAPNFYCAQGNSCVKEVFNVHINGELWADEATIRELSRRDFYL